MANFRDVTEALQQGIEPSAICETCPWDRFCVSPPSMTTAQIEAEKKKAEQKDEEQRAKNIAEGKTDSMPLGSLMTVMLLSGKDTQAEVCPVMANRLRSSDGRTIVDSIRAQMQRWDDNRVEGID